MPDNKQTKASLAKVQAAASEVAKKIAGLQTEHKKQIAIAHKDGASLKKRLGDLDKDGKADHAEKDPEAAKLTKSLKGVLDVFEESPLDAEHKKMTSHLADLKKIEKELAASKGKDDAETKKLTGEIQKTMEQSESLFQQMSQMLKEQTEAQKVIINQMKT